MRWLNVFLSQLAAESLFSPFRLLLFLNVPYSLLSLPSTLHFPIFSSIFPTIPLFRMSNDLAEINALKKEVKKVGQELLALGEDEVSVEVSHNFCLKLI